MLLIPIFLVGLALILGVLALSESIGNYRALRTGADPDLFRVARRSIRSEACRFVDQLLILAYLVALYLHPDLPCWYAITVLVVVSLMVALNSGLDILAQRRLRDRRRRRGLTESVRDVRDTWRP